MPVFSYPALFTTAPTVDPVMLLILGILMDALAGGARVTRVVPGPTLLLDRMVRYLEPKLNRSRRTTGTRLVRGLLLVVFVALVAALAGLGFLILARWLPGSWVIEVALIAALLGQGTVFMDVIRARATNVAPNNDPHQIARDQVETLAHGFIDRGVAPLFWFLMLGLPGMLIYRALAVTARRVGNWDRAFRFGWAAARCYDVATVLPAILGSLVLVAAGFFVPQAAPLRGLGIMVRRGGAFPSFAQGWPIAAVAGVLGLSLGGPRPEAKDDRVFAGVSDIPWIGAKDGRARANDADVRRALFLYGIAGLLMMATALFAAFIFAA